MKNGELTGGGTINIGWDTYEEAKNANPPFGPYTSEVFDRYSSHPADACISDGAIKEGVNTDG